MRHAAMTARAGQVTHIGIRLRAAAKPIGSDSSTPKNEASTAISSDSVRPL